MPRDARFWRNVTIIAVAHIAIDCHACSLEPETPRANLQSIVWMSGGGFGGCRAKHASENGSGDGGNASAGSDAPRSKPEEQDELPVADVCQE